MYQTIHEPIEVIGMFQQGKFLPKKFQWQRRTHRVSQVTLQVNLKDGGVRQRMYAVMAGGNLYRLLYNRESEEWWLEEIWFDS